MLDEESEMLAIILSMCDNNGDGQVAHLISDEDADGGI